MVHTPHEHADLVARQVVDLRLTAARYPADTGLRRLVRELTAQSPRFAELWDSGEVDLRQDQSRHKTIEHPGVGRITLDCDVLIVAAADLRIMVYTAEPGTEDADRLALAVVLDTQVLTESHLRPAGTVRLVAFRPQLGEARLMAAVVRTFGESL